MRPGRACVLMCVCIYVLLLAHAKRSESANNARSFLSQSHTCTQEHRHAHQHERCTNAKKEREQQSAKIQKKGASKVAGIAKSGPPKAKNKPTTRMASRLTIDDERDLIVAVLAQHFRGPATAKQAWFRELGSDLRDAVIAKWLETFRFPANNQDKRKHL
jgi:hypothetical protein